MIVVLDTGPLGMVTHPRASDENHECGEWLVRMLTNDVAVIVPEITDYELRRELLRAGKTKSVKRLDALVRALFYLPLTTPVMRRAAVLWAQARNQGRPTAPMAALDADVILAAQTLSVSVGEESAIVATTNVGHLGRFVDARTWREIA